MEVEKVLQTEGKDDMYDGEDLIGQMYQPYQGQQMSGKSEVTWAWYSFILINLGQTVLLAAMLNDGIVGMGIATGGELGSATISVELLSLVEIYPLASESVMGEILGASSKFWSVKLLSDDSSPSVVSSETELLLQCASS